jgi:hypothetical protein
MVIGFTGTRKGMTTAQRDAVAAVLRTLNATVLHHGDCVGADAQANEIARALGLRVVLHPPDDGRHRAFCRADEVRSPRSYLVRNHDIVNDAQVLVATPGQQSEVMRSGTWATIRYARKLGVRTVVIYPSGNMEDR